jgi:hypothetical protein
LLQLRRADGRVGMAYTPEYFVCLSYLHLQLVHNLFQLKSSINSVTNLVKKVNTQLTSDNLFFEMPSSQDIVVQIDHTATLKEGHPIVVIPGTKWKSMSALEQQKMFETSCVHVTDHTNIQCAFDIPSFREHLGNVDWRRVMHGKEA